MTFPADPAPVDRAGLEEVLRPFGESRMLPREAYVDPAVFAWEQRVLFGGGWVCVAFASQVLSPGSQWASSFGVLLARGEDGVLRAFANTCRHRGHELLACGSSSQAPMIICPYHGWTYTLAGDLRAAGSFKAVRGFDFGSWGLRALPVTEWHGLVFVDASGGAAASLVDVLGELGEIVAPYEPERLVTGGRHSYDVAANWKILTENYHECYHCPSIHPELCRVSPPKSGVNYAADGAWMGGWMALRDGMATMSLSGASGSMPLRGLSSEGLRTVIYVNILPNVLLSLHPDYVMTHLLVPVAADQTRIECTWAFAPEAVTLPGFDPGYAVEFWDLTNRQDWAACESVQRGLASPHASPGPMAPEEDAVYSFVTTIARAYLGQVPWA